MRTNRSFLKGLLSVCAVLVTFFGYGQQETSLIPPPPEAASFFKSTEIPVSAYTGLPNIGVDFFTIKTKELQIPIRLTYNARGIQVAEMASRAGIGWALQYGGMISRQIRGSADELPRGILSNSYYNQVFNDVNVRAQLHADIVNFGVDEVPDQFYFDVNGQSGKFLFDFNDDQIVLQKFADITIVPTKSSEGFISWIVTDKLGNKYYYGRSKDGTRQANDYDFSTLNYSFGSWSSAVSDLGSSETRPYSAWHLMEIETYLGETIEFFYEEELGIQYRRSFDKIEDINFMGAQQKQAACYFSKVSSIQHQIQEIRFPGGKVQFEKEEAERLDYTNTHGLKKLMIKDDQEQVIKGFEFTYSYQRCNDDQNQLSHLKLVDPTANYRLFLTSIKELGSDTSSLPPYQFAYNPVKLPNRFSNSQDNWGYYNGKPNGQYLTFYSYFNHVNRRVDTALAGAGLLQKITYPTGGSVQFIYEQNRVMPPPYMSSLLTNPNNPVDTLSVGEAFFKDNAFYADGMYSKVITIGEDIKPLSTVRFSFVLPMGTDPSVSYYQVWLEKLDGSVNIFLDPPTTEQQLNLTPGQYRLKVMPINPNGLVPAFIASLDWTIIDNNPDHLDAGEWYGAGKRIKRIEHKVGNDLIRVKEYKFLNQDGKTSGKMFGLPNFYYIKQPMGNLVVETVDQYGSVPGSPLTQLQGNSIGYERVTEFNGDSSANQGKTEYEFTVEPDGGKYYTFPYHLPNDMEWVRGMPTSTKVYKNNAGSYELQRSTENTYLYNGTLNNPGFLGQPFVNADSGYVYRKDRIISYLPLLIITNYADPHGIKVYHLSAGTVDLDSSVEKNYVNGAELVQTVKYGYNYAKHYLPVAQRTITSKGDTLRTSTFYPLDLDSTIRTSAEQRLIVQHRTGLPVKVETVVKNNSNLELSKITQHTVYKDWGNDLVLMEKMQASMNRASFHDEVVYTRYNELGSPLEILPKAGITEVYVWGYQKQYPVAKVVGSDYATVISKVDTNLLYNAAQYSDAVIRAELHKIRTGLAATSAQVFTYTYKPLVGLTSATDGNNQTAYYEYDGFNRLSLIRDDKGNMLKKYCYNYQGQMEDCGMMVFTSTKSGTFTKQCASGGAGSLVTYTVTKTSTLSQGDADSKALAEVAANGQMYADQNGTCTWSNDLQQNTFTRQCNEGGIGSAVTYSVAAGTYTSQLSRADANNKAQAQVNANGQSNANSLGTCTWVSDDKSGNYFKQSCPTGQTANAYYVSVLSGMFSSTTSKTDANQKATTYAQNLANQNGTCAVVCSSGTCSSQGAAYKCVSGNCEMGIKVFTDSYYDAIQEGNVCIYHYEWSDGSWSQNYTFFAGFFSCNVGR